MQDDIIYAAQFHDEYWNVGVNPEIKSKESFVSFRSVEQFNGQEKGTLEHMKIIWMV